MINLRERRENGGERWERKRKGVRGIYKRREEEEGKWRERERKWGRRQRRDPCRENPRRGGSDE